MNRITLRATLAALALASLLYPTPLRAQTEPAAPEIRTPGAAPQAAPISEWQKEFNARLLTDFPWLARFKEADLKLAPPAAGENRVVFMGDSITEGWHFDGPDGSFPGKPYINRGISGQTTPQMLVRFRQDVIALQPKVVVILAGINDIAGNTGPMTLEADRRTIWPRWPSWPRPTTFAWCSARCCRPSIFPGGRGLTPAPKVIALNEWIKAYAAQDGLRLCGLPHGDEGQPRRPARSTKQGRRTSACRRLRDHGAAGGGGNREGAEGKDQGLRGFRGCGKTLWFDGGQHMDAKSDKLYSDTGRQGQ